MPVYNPGLKKLVQALRKNMTGAERLVWSRIRGKQLKGLQVYRQRIIGNYIADFYCPKAKLVIELDGGQHFSEEGLKKDSSRDLWIEAQGLRVVRFSDTEVFSDIDGVLERIYENM